MLLTRRPNKAISRWLPNEIITEIVQAAPRSDQALLCRVSKLFRDLCLPILYRVVDLQAKASVAEFGHTVLSNPALAGLVRSYSVGPSMSMNDVSPILVDSSKAFVRLEALSIHRRLLTETGLENLLRWTFPHLVRCNLSLVSSGYSHTEPHTLASFLIRHSGLEKLHIRDFSYGLPRPSTSACIPLLRLQQLGCPSRIIPFIAALRLKRVKLYWDDDLDVGEIENTFVALKAMITSDVLFISSNANCDKNLSAVVDSLSRNLPHTRTLQLLSFFSPPLTEVIGHLKNYLPRFTGLAFLSVQYEGFQAKPSTGKEEEEINVLGDVCPTLQACRLHQRAWRKVEGMWETYPLTDFDALAGLESWTL